MTEPCPRCTKPTTSAARARHRGVCARCAKEIKAGGHSGSSHGHVDASRAGFVDGHVEQVVQFPFEQVESDLDGPLTKEESRAAAMAIGKYCAALFEAGGVSARKFFQAAHAFAFACGVHPEQAKSGEEIAEKFGITKAGFFKQVNHIRDRLDLPRIAGAKNQAARRTYAATTKRSHERRRRIRERAAGGGADFGERFSQAIVQTRQGTA